MKNLKYCKNVYQNLILSMQDPNCATDEIITQIKDCVEKATTIQNKKKVNRDKIIEEKMDNQSNILVPCKKNEYLYNLWRNNKESDSLRKKKEKLC